MFIYLFLLTELVFEQPDPKIAMKQRVGETVAEHREYQVHR